MSPGFTTWDALGTIAGRALLIVNSPIDRAAEVEAVLGELSSRAEVHLIAPAAWRDWLNDRRVAAERVRFAVDQGGGDLELNYFLETPGALKWIGDRFVVIAGTAPHSLYNDEVKTILEQRIALLLGNGLFLTHALPERGLYLFDVAGLVERFGRSAKEAMYRSWCRTLVDDLHSLWVEQGRPGAVDAVDRSAVIRLLTAHLGEDVMDFDEAGPIPFALDDGIAGAAADVLRHLRDVIQDRDAQAAAIAEQVDTLQRDRNQVMAERNEAVEARDRTIASLEAKLESPLTKVRRRLKS